MCVKKGNHDEDDTITQPTPEQRKVDHAGRPSEWEGRQAEQ